MGPALSVDQRPVAAQLAGRDSVLSVPAGDPQNRLFHQCHREPKHELPQGHQDARRISFRRCRLESDVPGAPKPGQKMECRAVRMTIYATSTRAFMGWSAAITGQRLGGYKRLTEEIHHGTTHHRHRSWKDSISFDWTQSARRSCSAQEVLADATGALHSEPEGRFDWHGSLWRSPLSRTRALRNQGHEVRLMPAQYVKPYVKTNKSDYIDAEAIAEAVARPTMRFVPIKTDDQLDMQSLHRVRERWVMRRTAVVNQIRGLLLERGITLPKGRRYVDRALPEILVDPALRLAGSFRVLLGQLQLELEQLSARIEQMDAVIQETAKENEACQRLTAIPGIGPVTATALVAAIGNGAGFRRGKDLAAWVGMVPREYSTREHEL